MHYVANLFGRTALIEAEKVIRENTNILEEEEKQ